MAHFAVIAPPLPGHWNPLGALALTLIARGHRVTFVHDEKTAPLLSRFPGVRLAPLSDPHGAYSRWSRAVTHVRGLRGLHQTFSSITRMTRLLCDEAPRAIRDMGADVVIADQLEPAGGLVARHLGLPLVTTATALPMNREPGVPPPFVDWGYDPSPEGSSRNRGGWRVSDLVMRGIHTGIQRNAARLGVEGVTRGEDCYSPTLQIAQAVPSVDFPRAELPAAFHYTGPWRVDDSEPLPFPLRHPDDDPRPLVFCSLGTLLGGRVDVFRKIAAAAGDLDVQLLVAHGGRLTPKDIASLPGRPLTAAFVPQRAVLERASAVVTHGGFNTVLDALAAGLPMVVVPLGFEQPATAARLKRAGVGEVVKIRRASPRILREALERVLHDVATRARARELRREVLAAGGVERAADLVEEMLRKTAAGRERPSVTS